MWPLRRPGRCPASCCHSRMEQISQKSDVIPIALQLCWGRGGPRHLHISNQMPPGEFPLVTVYLWGFCQFLPTLLVSKVKKLVLLDCVRMGEGGRGWGRYVCVCVFVTPKKEKIFWLWKNLQREILVESLSKSTWESRNLHATLVSFDLANKMVETN